ncbi:MAG: cyclase family protein [Chloroflexi bacterium]|nr:MAG: cyclase family protein [Chloroflexota bacterium]
MTAARTIPTEAEILAWYHSLSNWGRWGPDDERGTLNLITPAKRIQAANLVREGLVISCARTIGYEYAADNQAPARHFMLQSGDGEPSQSVGRASAADAFLLAPHGVSMTHLDAPAHSMVRADPSQPWTIYNGKSAKSVTTAGGATVGSIEVAGGGIVSRGVLLDIPRLRDVPWLEHTEPVFPEDLDAAEASQGVRVQPADILFVRTGHPRRRAERGPRPPAEGICALQAACLPWLRERDVAVVGADTGNDVMPAEYPSIGLPVHGVAMGAIGLWILDNPDYEELAETCARLGRWDFQAVIAPLKLANGTGSPVNPLAVL